MSSKPNPGANNQTHKRDLALKISKLSKSYGRTSVLKNLSFNVRPGKVTGFLGPNGSGKSTTMKILLGLAAADKGSATIGGKKYREISNPTNAIGVVLEPNAFHPGRSGRNHLRVLATASGIPIKRVEEMLYSVGLEKAAADRKVGAYSLGMKQRLSLAAALLGDPQVLILDEPGNGLDPQGIRRLRDVLKLRASEGATVLVSSHLLSEMEHLADNLVVINKGQLVAKGTLSELLRAQSLVRVSAPKEFKKTLEDKGATVETIDKDGLLVKGLTLTAIGKLAYQADTEIRELSSYSSSIEELFFDLTAAETDNSSVSNTEEII